jgi:hypothetical protein
MQTRTVVVAWAGSEATVAGAHDGDLKGTASPSGEIIGGYVAPHDAEVSADPQRRPTAVAVVERE